MALLFDPEGVLSKTLGTLRHNALIAFLTAKRHAAGMSQAELAKALGEYQSYVARMESGQRRVDVIEYENLAEILGFDPREFFICEDATD
jgi:transcriptional regulator with XRE-family HTH domain